MCADTPLVSVVILIWNGLPDLDRCLDGVLHQDYPKIEIVAVDNASGDGSLIHLRERYPQVRSILNSRNLGFARGMNIGLAATQGKYVIPLNQDAFLDRQFVSSLVLALDGDPSLGAGSPAVRVLTAPTRRSKGGEDTEIGYQLQKRMRGRAARRAEDPQYVLGPSGACPFFRRDMLEDIALSPGQYYDERYVTGAEDIDLYLRMQLRNWRCRHVPQARCDHRGSGSVGGKLRLVEKPLWYQRNVLRNRYYTIMADLPGSVIMRILPDILLAEIGLWPYFLLISPKTIIALLWAWLDALRTFPYVVRKRRSVQTRRTCDTRAIMEHFVAF
jgi:GT2 family glycosyltransferase